MDKVLVIFGIVAIIAVVGCGVYSIVPYIGTDDVHHHYTIINKKIEGGYGSDLILVTTNGEYSVTPGDYNNANVNDTFDVITTEDGVYKKYEIIKNSNDDVK